MKAVEGELRARTLLSVGVAVGITLAALGVSRTPDSTPAPDVVALVNGERIRADAFSRFQETSAARSGAPGTGDRRALLQRMIDEELLLQRGLALGLTRLDPTTRGAILTAVVAAATAGSELSPPEDSELRRFYAEAPERFPSPLLLELDTAWVRIEGSTETRAYRRALTVARRAQAGEDFAQLRADLADAQAPGAPGEAAGLDAIRAALGDRAARAASELDVGGTSEPVRSASGWLVLRLRGRSMGPPAAFDVVRAVVRAEFLRRARERALEGYLADLRAGAEIEIVDPELQTP